MNPSNETLTAELNKVAAEAHQAFPEKLERLVVIFPPLETPVFVAPAVAAHLAENVAAVKKAVREWADCMRKRYCAGVASRNYPLAGIRVDMIAQAGDCIGDGSVESRLFNFHHEIGHHILRNGYPDVVSAQKAECAADAYAMLWHIQRFGMDTWIVRSRAQFNAALMIFNEDTDHYTVKALQRAIEVAKEKDLSALSPREIAAEAENIADACALDEETLGRVCNAFEPARAHLDKEMGGRQVVMNKLYKSDKNAIPAFCRVVLDVMCVHADDADIFEAGKQYLSRPCVAAFMQEQAKTDPFYKDALAFLDRESAEGRIIHSALYTKKPYF